MEISKTKIILLAIIFCSISGWAQSSQAATIVAASCGYADVNTALGEASANDVISIPVGTCSWAGNSLTINKTVTLQGAGIGNTIIEDGAFSDSVAGWKIKDFTFQYSSVTQLFLITNSDWLIEGNKFSGYPAGMARQNNGAHGTWANNLFVVGNNADAIIYANGRQNADWLTPSYFGQAGRFTFLEDNKFLCSAPEGSTYCSHIFMAQWGGSVVARCNLIEDADATRGWDNPFDGHNYGLGSAGSPVRAGREIEAYGNKFQPRIGYPMDAIWIRGGSGRIFNNVWDLTAPTFHYYPGGAIYFREYRETANGTYQYPLGSGNDYCGSITGIYTNNATGGGCVNNEGYPCCDGIGMGQDVLNVSGPGRQTAMPIYVWNNKSTLGVDVSVAQDTSTVNEQLVLQAGRDYIVNAGAPAGYVPYVYPHPARNLAATITCLTDAKSQAKTGIEFWSLLTDIVPPANPTGLSVI